MEQIIKLIIGLKNQYKNSLLLSNFEKSDISKKILEIGFL